MCWVQGGGLGIHRTHLARVGLKITFPRSLLRLWNEIESYPRNSEVGAGGGALCAAAFADCWPRHACPRMGAAPPVCGPRATSKHRAGRWAGRHLYTRPHSHVHLLSVRQAQPVHTTAQHPAILVPHRHPSMRAPSRSRQACGGGGGRALCGAMATDITWRVQGRRRACSGFDYLLTDRVLTFGAGRATSHAVRVRYCACTRTFDEREP